MLTRRAALAAGLFTAMPFPVRAASGPVAIVGAGAAGLAAAETFRRAGHPFVLLEARDRIGGRAHTDHSLGPAASFDAGAQYIHWAERNPWSAIARERGVKLSDQDGWARNLFIDGRPATEAERNRRRAGFTGLDSMIAPKGEDASLADEVRLAAPEVQAAVSGLSRLSLGEDPARVSAVDYDRLWSGSDLWVDGYGDLVAWHYAHLPVRLNCPVKRIDWSGPGVRLHLGGGILDAAAAIVTVPVGVLKSGSFVFTPALPSLTQAALNGLTMGAYTKIALRLDRAKVDPRALGDAVSVVRDGPTIYLEMGPFGHPVAIANLGGDMARDLCRAGEAAAVSLATERLAVLLGTQATGAVTGGRLAGWWTDPYARGSYSIALPGHGSARDVLQAPIGDRIFLAGEALAGPRAMTVGGATLDGERAAKNLLKRLPA